MDNEKKYSRQHQVRMRKRLLIIWAIFIPVLVVVILFVVKNKDELITNEEQTHIYQVDANAEINKLITDYFTAYAACDQMTLQKLVVDPSRFDDMTIVQKKAAVVTGYSNIKCYTVPGKTEDATIVYAVANISIANVVSTPLDMNPALYVVKKENGYLIDNSALSKDILNYIESTNQKQDILDLMKMVKDDQEVCAAKDETFKKFYEKLTKKDQPSTSSTSSP
jgi:hypothetical protein